MSECGELLEEYVTEQGRVSFAEGQLGRLDQERQALADEGTQNENDASELENQLIAIDGEVEDLRKQQEGQRAERFGTIDQLVLEIDARLQEIDGRLNEILAELSGGVDEPPPGPEQVSALFGEARTLAHEESQLLADRGVLLAEQASLLSGVGDPGRLQPTIDARVNERATASALLDEVRKDRADIADRQVANFDQREEQETVRADAARARDRAQADATAAGCDWALEPPSNPEQPSGDAVPADSAADTGVLEDLRGR
jgi:chromosome segregation ATPase